MNGRASRDASGGPGEGPSSFIGMTAAGLTSGTGSGSILKVQNLVKHFPVRKGLLRSIMGYVKAVDGVSLDLKRGETLGLVGESGCGKTTLGRCVLYLEQPTSGRIIFDGTDVTAMSSEELRPFRRNMQIIFQDPFSSLNPRMTVLDIVGEAMVVHGLATRADVERKVVALMAKVGLPGAWINRYPHEFSGGQRQRIGIARALALNPKLIVCDEPVSALDVSIQAQVLNLLIALREEMNLSYLFIAHNLGVVKHISHRIAVMYLGKIVEIGTTEAVFATPSHPYTQALLSAIPHPDPHKQSARIVLQGDVPSPLNPPMACAFHPRCPAVMERCRLVEPGYNNLGGGHFAKCYLSSDIVPQEGWYDRLMKKTNEMIARNRERTAEAATAAATAASITSGSAGVGVRGQGLGISEQSTGIWGQGSGVRGQKGATYEPPTMTRKAESSIREIEPPIVNRPSPIPETQSSIAKRQSPIPETESSIATTQFTIPNPQSAIQKPKTENQKSETENRKPKTENRKPKTENRKPKTLWGWLLLGAGGISMLAGAFIIGLALALAGYFIFLLPRAQKKMHLTAGVLIGLLLCAWIGQGIQSHSKRALAWREYYALKDQVRAYREATGEYPDTLQRLGWRLSEVFPNSQPTDPWGRPWQYRYPVKDWRDQPSFALSSPGPDGKPDTSDDITAK